MAEVVVNIVVEQLIFDAAEWLKEEISLLKGVTRSLGNMKSKLQSIQMVLEDAENKSVKEKYVKLWLGKLQDVSYDMDDVLDEWNTRVRIQKRDEAEEDTSNEIVGSSSSSSTTSKFTCFSLKQLNLFSSVKQVGWRRDMAFRIKDINERMNLVFLELNRLELASKAVGNDGLTKIINHKDIGRTTTSFVDESKVYGRDEDKDFLLSKVLSVNTEQQKSMQVISIVGVGGLGKTTLAQLVYNDENVKNKFGKNIIWVCVSDPFNEVKVAKNILDGLKVDHTKTKNLQTLYQSIEESLSKKKFLLILDDVWDEDFDKWEQLSICLKLGDPGSRILVTTRKEEVARIMGTSPSNILKPQLISDLDCWWLMSQIAFEGRPNRDTDKLEDIGKEIAKKCKGLPLAAKMLGGMLILKDVVEDWTKVLNSEIWMLEKVEIKLFRHIFLSYQELPSVLKRCFLILAMFPKDSYLDAEQVIHFWMAHGFLNPKTEEEDIVKTGQKYLKFLVSRAFLEEDKSNMVSMHDIMHDFALHLLGDELLSIMVHDNTEYGSSSESTSKRGLRPRSTKARHLMIEGNIDPSSIGFDVGKLRTCIISNVLPNVASDLVKGLKMVRVLYLVHCDLIQVPESIVELIHLRILYLNDNPLVELPETIGDLYNLQVLSLVRLHSLSSLPHSLGKLINLMSLIPVDLALEMAPESVGRLISLQKLGRVRVEAGNSKLAVLKDLNELRGLLEIEFNSDYSDEVDAREATIGRKKDITELALYFNDHKVTDGVVAALQPSPNIETLRIYGLLPNWITSLDHLAELEVHEAKNVSTLPPLWKLQFLKKLLIYDFTALEIIGREFLGMDRLVELKFFDCHELRGWKDLTEEEDANRVINVMPNLEILQFENCNKFDELPRWLLRQASSLKKLLIKKEESLFDFDVTEIEGGVGGLRLHRGYERLEMSVKNSRNVLTSINYHSCITLLDLYCQASPISHLPPMGKLPYLESLTISEFSSVKFIGREFLGVDDNTNDEDFVAFPKLLKLGIYRCNLLEGWEDLKQEDEGKITVMPKLEELQIRLCQKFEVLPCRLLLQLPSSLKVLVLPDGEAFVNLPSEEAASSNGVVSALPHPPALEMFSIKRYKGTKLPNWIIYLNNLTKLEVFLAENVLSLPALGKLPSLEVLDIESFSVLKFMGREFLGIDNSTSKDIVSFPKLYRFSIRYCGELKEWEDIKPEEEDQITIMPNLTYLDIIWCDQLEALPRRLLCKTTSLKQLTCNYNNSSLAENIKKDKQLLGRIKKVYVDGEQCSLHPSAQRRE